MSLSEKADTELHSARLRGPYVFLRPVMPEDYGFLRAVELDDDLVVRWRMRGQVPSPEQWAASLWSGVLAQFIVVETSTSRPIGMVALYQANFQDRHAYFAAARFRPARRTPLLIFGIAMAIEYAFTCWDFQKLYMELPEYNFAQFSSGEGRYFEVEGRLKGHLYAGGRRWDQLILAVERDHWREMGSRMVGRTQAPVEPGS